MCTCVSPKNGRRSGSRCAQRLGRLRLGRVRRRSRCRLRACVHRLGGARQAHHRHPVPPRRAVEWRDVGLTSQREGRTREHGARDGEAPHARRQPGEQPRRERRGRPECQRVHERMSEEERQQQSEHAAARLDERHSRRTRRPAAGTAPPEPARRTAAWAAAPAAAPQSRGCGARRARSSMLAGSIMPRSERPPCSSRTASTRATTTSTSSTCRATLWQERLPAKFREFGAARRREGGRRAVERRRRASSARPAGRRIRPRSRACPSRTTASARAIRSSASRTWSATASTRRSCTGRPRCSASRSHDPEHQQAALRAWNDWAAEEFNAYAPERLFALPFLPATSPEDAVAELAALRGARSPRRDPLALRGRRRATATWDRLWAAAAEARLPISFHIGGGSRIRPREGGWQIAGFAAVAPMQLDEPLASMMFSGALERHPGLRLVLAESGVGWVPYFVARMDATFEKHCAPHPQRASARCRASCSTARCTRPSRRSRSARS